MGVGKLIRAISLVIVIVFGAIFVAINWIAFIQNKFMIVPAVCFSGIYAWVLGCEVWGAVSGYKKTLSTRWNHWAKEHPVLSWAALISFAIAMVALVPHLGVYW